MSADLKTLLGEVSSYTPSLKNLIRQRETAAMAIKTFHNEAEHYLLQEKLARLSLAEVNAKIKQLFGDVP